MRTENIEVFPTIDQAALRLPIRQQVLLVILA